MTTIVAQFSGLRQDIQTKKTRSEVFLAVIPCARYRRLEFLAPRTEVLRTVMDPRDSCSSIWSCH